jgi:asparagine N-glycosylation enzyme membrane subunit Stt3
MRVRRPVMHVVLAVSTVLGVLAGVRVYELLGG